MEAGAARPDDPPYLKSAFAMLGLSEIEGARHEKRILDMYKASGHPEVHDDETPWCAAFVGDCLSHAGLPNTGSLLASSYINYGTRLALNGMRVPRGAICVWSRTGGNHVNFCLADDGNTLTCIGGNQENGKGGGVTVSRRSKASGLRAAVLPPAKKATAPKPGHVPPPPDIEPTPEPKTTKPAVQSTEIWSQLAAIIAAIGSVVTDVRFLALIVVLFCAYQIWMRYSRGDIKGLVS